jgi:SAM-dependent methyltransferase
VECGHGTCAGWYRVASNDVGAGLRAPTEGATLESLKTTVILPALGAQPGLATVIRDIAVAAYALRTRDIQLDLLLAADGDADAARSAASELGLQVSSVPVPAGLGAAYLAAFREVIARGTADLVVTLDATGQHDAAQIPRMIDQMLADKLDVVIGSRWARHSGTPGLTVGRWAMGKLANRTFRVVTGIRGVTDVTTAFRVARMSVLRQLDLDRYPADPRGIQMAFVADAVARGCRVGEAPIIYRPAAGSVAPVKVKDMTSFGRYLPELRGQTRETRRVRLSPQGRQFTHTAFGAASDLERLGTADRFFGWVLHEFQPYLKGRVLEVGAGLGTITRKLVEADPAVTVVALEPAENLFDDLTAVAAANPRIIASQLTSGEYLDRSTEQFDAVIYLNVLEHIEHDVEELKITGAALRPGGHLLVFGPGLQWLYSELDYNAGHYRRYTLAGLRKVVEAAGLQVVSLRYMDVVGVLPYWVVYRLLRSQAISGGSMWGYDRVLVPVSRTIQRVLRRPPLGKNVILVARKPG